MFQAHQLPVDFAKGAFHLTKLLGTGGMAAVYAADVDLDKFDFATIVAHHERAAGRSRTERVRRREQRLQRWKSMNREELRALCLEWELPFPQDKLAAVKILFPHLGEHKDRFEAEWHSMLSVQHPNLVTVYSGGRDEDHGVYYYSMELLHDIVPITMLSLAEKIEVFRQAAAGLQQLHDNGLVHRDVKPDNVVCTRHAGELRARVTDLGIAKDVNRTQELTVTNTVMGTTYYMPPEQAASARTADHISDIYSLGATLYRWVSGRAPYEGETMYVIMGKLATGRPPESLRDIVDEDSLPENLIVLIERMMAMKREQRPSDFNKIIEATASLESLSLQEMLDTLGLDMPKGLPGKITSRFRKALAQPSRFDDDKLKIPGLGSDIVTDTTPGPSISMDPALADTKPASPVIPHLPEPSTIRPAVTQQAAAGPLIGMFVFVVLAAVLFFFRDVIIGPPAVVDKPPKNVPKPVDEMAQRRQLFKQKLELALEQADKLIAKHQFNKAEVLLRGLHPEGVTVGLAAQVDNALANVDTKRKGRIGQLELAVRDALAETDGVKGVAKAIEALAALDPKNQFLAGFARQLQDNEDKLRQQQALDALVKQIQGVLDDDPLKAGPLIRRLEQSSPAHPKLAEFRKALADAVAKADLGKPEQAAAHTSYKLLQEELKLWPAELLTHFELSAPEAVAATKTRMGKADQLIQSGKGAEAAREFVAVREGFEKCVADFRAAALVVARKAHAELNATADRLRQIQSRWQLAPSPGLNKALFDSVPSSKFHLRKEQAREVLLACKDAQPVLTKAVAAQVTAAKGRTAKSTAQWTKVAGERGIDSPPTRVTQALAKMKQAAAAKDPVAAITLYEESRGLYEEAIKVVERIPKDLPFKMPPNWEYIGRSTLGFHEVRSRPDGARMTYIAAGSFWRGATMSAAALSRKYRMAAENYTDELPRKEITLGGYFIDQHEVTNERYAKFIAANQEWQPGGRSAAVLAQTEYLTDWRGLKPPAGREKHPVVWVSWHAAVAYCKWAGKRLPTEAEWERAARGDDKSRRSFPWGEEFLKKGCCNSASYWADSLLITQRQLQRKFTDGVWAEKGGATLTSPVGKFPTSVSPFGLHDMAGNVWEWCVDTYDSDYYASASSSNPRNDGDGSSRAARGGSWKSAIGQLRTANRRSATIRLCDATLGFRSARSATSR